MAPVPSPSTETHPFRPFLPKSARLLMLGTFPPAEKRWCMPFYYPNFTNDMWRIFGLCFFGERDHFVVPGQRRFDMERIKSFLTQKRIAMYDTAVRVVRTRNTASDKDLHIVEPTDVASMLAGLPQCRAVITAGQLATDTFCQAFALNSPKVGTWVDFALPGTDRTIRLYRMPSSSRAYPMATEQKALLYREAFKFCIEDF